jgi:hypothetical protein
MRPLSGASQGGYVAPVTQQDARKGQVVTPVPEIHPANRDYGLASRCRKAIEFLLEGELIQLNGYFKHIDLIGMLRYRQAN